MTADSISELILKCRKTPDSLVSIEFVRSWVGLAAFRDEVSHYWNTCLGL